MHRFALNWVCVSVATLIAPYALGGEQPDRSLLTVERIFDDRDFAGESFSARWAKDGSGYLTLESSADAAAGRDIVLHDVQSGKAKVLVSATRFVPPGESGPLPVDDYAFSADDSLVLIFTNSKRVWRANTRGDYWLLDRSSHELRKLGGDAKPATLMFAKLSPTARHVAYVRENNLYVEDLVTRQITALTATADRHVINGTFDWVYEEELNLRDGFAWSPDGTRIAYWQLDTSGVPEFTLINNTDALYPRLTTFAYPKVGQQNSACRVGVVAATGGETRWLNVPGDPRQHYLARLSWTPDSQGLVLQQLNRRQNTNLVLLADASTGQVTTILTERDEAWVDVDDEWKWLADGQRFAWISDRDGWRHVYLASCGGQDVKLATPGEFDVTELLHVDEGQNCLYFVASPDNPTQRYLYRIGWDGTKLERITPAAQKGWHAYQISPNGRYAIHSGSAADSPPVVELVDLPQHSAKRVLAENAELRKRFGELQKTPTEFVRVDIGDDVSLDGWCLKPPDLDATKKYPLLVYVYGEPAGQTVVDRWGGRNYLWHLMLAQRGYVVMSFDNRGTPAPRGRAWRKAMYRKLGILGPADQAAALEKMLAVRPYLDPQRVGIWGWSGGGSTSLHAIFKYPHLYNTAMAVAPVPNRRFYDTIYEERYMGLPGDNPDAYLQGSALNFAHQLQGNLLLVHGTGDDNCHYQGTESLINELVRLNKPFTMMAYPNRAHSIGEGAGTTRHLRELLTRYLTENLPAGAR
ncbi:MAG TPA: S9 family peptidase [Candidatus Anammoximicrobium sp.]|nr:S9 family peptidase [Candidatus Anammoximicrobium sp.]